MKVDERRDRTQIRSGLASAGRALAATAAAIALFATVAPAPAAAITRPEVVSRASSWVAKRVIYSQSANFAGYRRDCSGFVSMAWELRTSLTTRTLSRVGTRIPFARLRPGDAILQPGHVQIFAGWKSRRAGTYIALEESNWGLPALRRVKTLPSNGMGLRLRAIQDSPVSGIPSAPVTTLLSELPSPQPLPLFVLPGSGDTTLAITPGIAQ